MGAAKIQAVAIGAAALVGGLVLWKMASAGKGLVTGYNVLTRTATDSDGNRVSAYQGVPIVGTLGAAANAASGGYLATFGGWLGRSAYDLFNPSSTPDADELEAARESARLARLYPPPAATGPDSIFNSTGSFGQLGGLDGGSFDFQHRPLFGG